MKCYKKDYPRPQFVRADWENLNGVWNFGFDDENVGEAQHWYDDFSGEQQIQVPFTYETKCSGIQDETRHDNIWYQRIFCVDSVKLKDCKLLLHFEGSDYVTKLWVNGQFAGSHRGGYSRFSFDITDLVTEGENRLTVKVEDSFDKQQPRGKQRWNEQNFECWYLHTTGIWKTVWVEYVPKYSLSGVKMTPDLQNSSLELELEADVPESYLNGQMLVETIVSFQGEPVSRTFVTLYAHKMTVSIDLSARKEQSYSSAVKLWSPEAPNLYDVTFRLMKNEELMDRVDSYFAMREIRIEGRNILLNGRPLYQRLILDQGYWRESNLTPPSEEALIEDIDKVLAMGYNGLRKHQKVEDERFLYWCDVKGMLVWCEMAAAYQYSDCAVAEFTKEWMQVVRQNYNHPCIIIWTPFNESWGVEKIATRKDQQHFTEAIYYLTKSIDRTRPVIVNDGWEHTISDILTIHDYEENGEVLKAQYLDHKDEVLASEAWQNSGKFAFAKGYEYKGQPVIISEYGGIAFDNDDNGWGYGNKVTSKEAFVERFDKITTAIKELPYVCGYCYTQVSDVWQEINGLMDMERNYKVEPEIIREINER